MENGKWQDDFRKRRKKKTEGNMYRIENIMYVCDYLKSKNRKENVKLFIFMH